VIGVARPELCRSENLGVQSSITGAPFFRAKSTLSRAALISSGRCPCQFFTSATTLKPSRARKEFVIWKLTFGAGAIQSRTTRTQEGFPRCRTPGEALGGPRVGLELCARSGATSVAHSDTQEVPVTVRSNTATEPIGVSAGRGTYQVVQFCLRSAGPQCPTNAEGDCRRRNPTQLRLPLWRINTCAQRLNSCATRSVPVHS